MVEGGLERGLEGEGGPHLLSVGVEGGGGLLLFSWWKVSRSRKSWALLSMV